MYILCKYKKLHLHYERTVDNVRKANLASLPKASDRTPVPTVNIRNLTHLSVGERLGAPASSANVTLGSLLRGLPSQTGGGV